MLTIIGVLCSAAFVHSGTIIHDVGGEHGSGGKATSYQTIHMEHFHAVPTYIKKEHKRLLEHPIPSGKSTSKVEVQHGDKHDHGYALVDSHNSARVSGHEGGYGGHESSGIGLIGHGGINLGAHGGSHHLLAEATAPNVALSHASSDGYQVHDQNQEYLQHYQQPQAYQGYADFHYQAAAASLGHADGVALDHYQAAGGNHQPVVQVQQNDVVEEDENEHTS